MQQNKPKKTKVHRIVTLKFNQQQIHSPEYEKIKKKLKLLKLKYAQEAKSLK